MEDRLNQWLATFADETAINFELVDVAITADDYLAFSHSYNHVTAALKNGGTLDMYWRETLNWRRTKPYSARNPFTGFAVAAFTAW